MIRRQNMQENSLLKHSIQDSLKIVANRKKKKDRKKMTYNFLLKRGFSEVLGYLITLLSTQKTGNFNQDGRLYVSCREFPKKYLNCLILLALNVNLLNFVRPIIFYLVMVSLFFTFTVNFLSEEAVRRCNE